MRAVEVKIHNVRSVHDMTLKVRELSLIAGANNSGKSNVIDAIRMFYGDLKWDEVRDFPKVKTSDDEAWVEIEFEPTQDELAQLKDDYRSPNGTFRVRNYVKATAGPDNKPRAGYYAYVEGNLSETLFYGQKNVGSGKVGKLVYIPAVSKVDEHTKFTGPSALRELTATVLSKVVASSSAYQTLASAFTTFESEIKTHASDDGKSLVALEEEITQELSSWDSSFTFGIQSVQPDDILKTLVKTQFVDNAHGEQVDQLRFGAGFQRHLVYTLIKMAAKYASGQKAPVTKKEFLAQLTWVLFEEPEAFLHPSQEEVLQDSLVALTADGVTQVLLTTHSSRFVSRTMNDLTRLIRLRRDAGVTTAFQLEQSQIDTLFDEALTSDRTMFPTGGSPDNVDKDAEMTALKVELWLQPTRSAAFFANRVILVEGPSESGLYSYLTSRGHMAVPDRGVVVVDCMGKYNIHRFVGLLGALGVDHSVLYDGDNGRAQDAEVTLAINSARNLYTRRVTRFGKDLETELGIQPLERRDFHKKPQYVLYNFTSGTVTDAAREAIQEEFRLLATER